MSCRLSITLILVVVLLQPWPEAEAQTMDQIISSSMQTSYAADFIQDEKTVMVELDMLFDADEWEEIQQAIDEDETIARAPNGLARRKKRKAARNTQKRWTNKVVPYQIAGGTFSQTDLSQINAAINDWEKYTCLDFKPRSSESNYIVLQNGAGFSSYVGMLSRGSQPVSLAPGCRVKGVIIHELGHAIGFQHEQTRPDRNNHVTINYGNIQRGTEFNFQQYSTSVVNDYGVDYDYSSVMHYGQYAFSINGQRTIVTIDPTKQNIIGNRQGLSYRDIKLANLMYNCAGHCGSKRCEGESFLGKDCECYCPGNPLRRCDGGDGGGEEDCEDKHVNCARWASAGECRANPGYMLQNCPLSCKQCDGGGPKECKDSAKHCRYWKNKGYCTYGKYVEYMKINCARTCGVCNGRNDAVSDIECKDKAGNCAYYHKRNCNARKYRRYMRTNCAKYCGVCSK